MGTITAAAPSFDAELLMQAQEFVHVGTWTWEIETDTMHWSDELFRLFGLMPQSLALGRETYLSFVHQNDRDRVAGIIRDAVALRAAFEFDADVVLRDGALRRHHSRGAVVCDAAGRVQRLIGACLDITERARQQDALRASEERFRSVFHQSAVGLALTDAARRFVSVNASFAHWLGYTAREMEGMRLLDVTHPDERERTNDVTDRVAAGTPETYEKRYVRKDGRAVWGRATVTSWHDDRGRFAGFMGVVEDITEAKVANEALWRQTELLQSILDHLPVMVSLCDVNGRPLYVNTKWQRLFGWSAEEARELAVLETLYPDEQERDRARQAVAAGTGEWGEYQSRTRDGKKLTCAWACINLSDGTSLRIGQDVTERRQLQHRVLQSQKMEALGQLAGGVAHDFNNLLTVISACATFLHEDLPEESAASDDLREITAACNRAAALTRQLLAFSRREMLQPEIVDVNATVQNMAKTLVRLIGEHITFDVEAESAESTVEADRHQLEQILLNLVVNARDAVEDGGTISVRTSNATRAVPDQPRQAYVVISVSDDGVGIDPAIRDRIFEPFFTTKPLGKGTGLGLSTVHGIVEQSGGFVEVDSTVGVGTTFRVFLPMRDARELGTCPAENDASPRGTGTILLVEDESALRAVARRALSMHGYTVLEARHGADALQVSANHPSRIELLVTDVVMPEVGGRELARAIRERRPGTLVLYVSGYTDDELLRKGILEPGAQLLRKPFTPAQLVRAVKGLLHGAATAAP